MNRLQPYYQVSGHYSEESIRILHNEFSQLTEEEISDVTPLMKASAEMALLQQQLRQHSLGNKIEITMMELAATNQGVASPDHNQYKAIYPEAETEPRAIRSNEWAKSYQNTTGGREMEKWREKSDGRIDGDVVKEQDVSTMNLGADTDSCALDIIDPRWNLEAVEAAGEQDEEGLIALVTSGGKDRNPSFRPVRTASEWDPGPRESDGEIVVARGNWINRVLFGDLHLVDQEPQEVEPKFRNPPNAMAKAAVPDQGDVAAQILCPPDDGIRLENQIPLTRSISILNTRLGQHCPSSWSPTTQPAGVGSGSSEKGSNSGNWRKITKVAAKNGSGNSAQNPPIYALYFEIWQGLKGGIEGRQIWDPGGKEAKFLLAVGRGG